MQHAADAVSGLGEDMGPAAGQDDATPPNAATVMECCKPGMAGQSIRNEERTRRHEPPAVEPSRTLSVDFHPGSIPDFGHLPYHEKLSVWYRHVVASLQTAQAEGYDWVEFTHGSSTSGPGKQTARSVVRGFMRSKAATPFIIRKESVQHESRYVARVRPVESERPS